MRIKDLVILATKQAKDKGFHEDESVTFGDRIALTHTELSEAMEEYRAARSVVQLWEDPNTGSIGTRPSGGAKPIGVPSELADVVIRVADICGFYGIDLEKAISEKLEYNATRAHKHGKAF